MNRNLRLTGITQPLDCPGAFGFVPGVELRIRAGEHRVQCRRRFIIVNSGHMSGPVLHGEEGILNTMNAPNPWRTVPLKTRIISLLAIFFIFAGIGFANDVIDMGRQPAPRFVASVVLGGLFAIGYAISGIILRKKFWKAFAPLFVAEFVVMGWLANRFPDVPLPVPLSAGATDHLHTRITWVGIAIIFCVTLGYTGLVYVSIRETRRYFCMQTEKATLESEMAAAREVQRVMVPEDLPPISGYAIESVYRPAAEVGGDFFQLIPLKSGCTLIVIGDVSGKGLPAAMIVSMIVGMLRTVSGFTEEPAEILAELNRRLCGRTQGGFATCLVARLEDSGRLALADAGHPPPYLNGTEAPLAGSMPLGIIETAAYSQIELEMHVGDRLMLLTDGIPEARNQEGVLLGFPRVEALLSEGASARSVAEAAQNHGQNDDITVISIARQAAEILSKRSDSMPENIPVPYSQTA
jgi:Stage II sporulation protein E (SpoIIE)